MERILFDQEKEFDILEIKGLMEKFKFKWVYSSKATIEQ